LKGKDLNRLREIAEKEGAPMQAIGEVGGSRLVVHPLIRLPVDELKSIWSSSLERRLRETGNDRRQSPVTNNQ